MSVEGLEGSVSDRRGKQADQGREFQPEQSTREKDVRVCLFSHGNKDLYNRPQLEVRRRRVSRSHALPCGNHGPKWTVHLLEWIQVERPGGCAVPAAQGTHFEKEAELHQYTPVILAYFESSVGKW